MPKLTVDGIEVEVPNGSTVLQACEAAGKEIPRFCYHERLAIAGNCRMCLVEAKPGPPKPQASCALPAADGQEIRTDTLTVKKAREGVMEFLLINHPLDCPICDQGGQCDLQDLAVGYGRGMSRFEENKRAVNEKYMGPLIATAMTRCIQCTRCVRFAEEVAGVEELGTVFRGENMQITAYLDAALTSELSGNVADLCPVGALNHKPYHFESRPWELRRAPAIDVFDAVGTNIHLSSRARQIVRAIPRINDDVNEEWAADKTRYAIDGLYRNRLDRPWVRREGKLQPVDWAEALAVVAERMRAANASVAAVAGALLDAETMAAAKSLLRSVGSDLYEHRQAGHATPTDGLAALRFNSGIAGIEEADAILLVGTNPRWEAPLVNTRLRKAVKTGSTVFAIGERVDLTYPVTWLGEDLSLLGRLPAEVAERFRGASKPAVILGEGATLVEGTLGDALDFANTFNLVREGWNGFNVLSTTASAQGALMLGFAVPGGLAELAARRPEVLFLLGADELELQPFAGAFTVYVGHHGDRGARVADVILPSASYAEKPGTYVNLEGRVQISERAVFPPGDAREDWSIFRALSDLLGTPLPFDTHDQLRARMYAEVPALARINAVAPAPWSVPVAPTGASGRATLPVQDFYLTDPISRASPTMRRCSAEILHGQTMAEAAE